LKCLVPVEKIEDPSEVRHWGVPGSCVRSVLVEQTKDLLVNVPPVKNRIRVPAQVTGGGRRDAIEQGPV
jgi:hypothetical protein